MYWHYRFVNLPSINDGEDHITLKEVHYSDDKSLLCVVDPCTFADDVQDLALLKEHMMQAWDAPIMQERDLPKDVMEGILEADKAKGELWVRAMQGTC